MYSRLPLTPLSDSIKNYSDIFNNHLLVDGQTDNFISSPLCAWLLLALVANNHGDENDVLLYDLEKALGMSTREAFDAVKLLLSTAPEVISASVGAWLNPDLSTAPAFVKWLESTRDTITSDIEIPSQDFLDAWTEEKTLGLIKKFPIEVDARTVFILATVLATKISWIDEFTVVENDKMPNWGVKNVLKASQEHNQWLAKMDKGLFAVHSARSNTEQGALTVFSVMGEPGLSSNEVLHAAHQIASDYVDEKREHVSLFDLPLGDTNSITITEKVKQQMANAATEKITSYLPVWKAKADHNIKEIVGFKEAFALFGGTKDLEMDVRQSAVASYDEKGFEAAAVTAMSFRAAGIPHFGEFKVREAEVKFDRPYAVIAVFHDNRRYQEGKELPNYALWNGLPAFTAWVTKATEAKKD